jgi:hypothetical protein
LNNRIKVPLPKPGLRKNLLLAEGLGSNHPLQPLLDDLLPRTLGGRAQPVTHLRYAHRMRHAGAPGLDLHLTCWTRQALVLAERHHRHRDGLIQRLCVDRHRVPDALVVGERDGASADGHEERVYQIRRLFALPPPATNQSQ